MLYDVLKEILEFELTKEQLRIHSFNSQEEVREMILSYVGYDIEHFGPEAALHALTNFYIPWIKTEYENAAICDFEFEIFFLK